MADYIYLLENRLSHNQRQALHLVREVAKSKAQTVFLVGGAVRDLTSGSPVRDLDVAVQGNALKLKKDLEKAGAVVVGEYDAGQALYLRFAGNVRLELSSTLSVTYPKPGKPVVRPATILDDLRRRDFTANAMALSLNEGSYGLLMDPLNGVADIENRELRLVSNYGFIEDPVRMIRAARLMARLGWTLDEKTQGRYDTGKEEGYIAALNDFQRGYELEELFHEEDPLRVLRRLESEGWMKHLAPYLTVSKVNVAEMDRLRAAQTQLELQNLHPGAGAAHFPLLTAKLSAKEIAGLKAAFPRPGFVREIESLEGEAKAFAAELTGKDAAMPSAAWRLIVGAAPEAVLWTAYSNKNAAVQARLKSFADEWPLARHRMPYTLLQEMRITPELEGYDALLERLFFELMDGRLTTPEETKAFLEPYSPPAPPPPVSLRRARASSKKEGKSRSRSKKAAADDVEDDLPMAAAADEETLEMAVEDAPEAEPQEPSAESLPNLENAEAAEPAPEPAKSAPAKGKISPGKAAAALPADKVSADKAVAAKAAPAKAAPKAVPAKTAAAEVKSPASASPAKAAAAPAKDVKVAAVAARTSGEKASVPAAAKTVAKVPAPSTAKPTRAGAKASTAPVSKSAAKPASAPAKGAAKPTAKAVAAPPQKLASAKAPGRSSAPAAGKKAAAKPAGTLPGKAAAKPAPAKNAPAKQAAAKTTPTKTVAAKSTPAKKTAAKSPAKVLPAKKTATKAPAKAAKGARAR